MLFSRRRANKHKHNNDISNGGCSIAYRKSHRTSVQLLPGSVRQRHPTTTNISATISTTTTKPALLPLSANSGYMNNAVSYETLTFACHCCPFFSTFVVARLRLSKLNNNALFQPLLPATKRLCSLGANK